MVYRGMCLFIFCHINITTLFLFTFLCIRVTGNLLKILIIKKKINLKISEICHLVQFFIVLIQQNERNTKEKKLKSFILNGKLNFNNYLSSFAK